jgi:hypothetical protein
VANPNKINLGALPPDVLNEQLRDKAYDSFNITTDSFMDVFQKLLKEKLSPDFSFVDFEFNGFVVQVLSQDEVQKLIKSKSPILAYQETGKTDSKTVPKACRVFIPEIHTDRSLPKSILSPTKKDKKVIEAMFPVFVSQTEELSKKNLSPGDRVVVKIKNNTGGGIYTNCVASTFSKNPVSEKKGADASDAFRCELIKQIKVKSKNPNDIAGNTTITEGGKPPAISAATISQQYIKFLYALEVNHLKEIKEFWTPEKFKAHLDASLEAVYDINEDLSGLQPLIAGLLYQVSGFIPAGLAAGGNTTISANAATTHYGVFRTTKKQFDDSIFKIGENIATTDEAKEFFAALKIPDHFAHSDLLNPDLAIKFFIGDFYNYLTKKSQIKLSKLASPQSLTGEQKKVITKYFTDSPDRVEVLFPSNFAIGAANNPGVQSIVGDYGKVGKVSPGTPPKDFLANGQSNFEDWLTMSMSGVSPEPASSTPIPSGSANPQGPEVEKPPATPDECHSNYPPYTDYAIHVDSQKKVVRDFLKSEISGQDLQLLKNSHEGVNNIKFGGSIINSPFKVVRFDGKSNFSFDSKRWFDKDNFIIHKIQSDLGQFFITIPERKERFAGGVYRNKDQVTHFTVQNLGNNLDDKYFFKSPVHNLVNWQKSIPHFIVAPNGQIIQLADAACVLPSSASTRLFSISAAFGFGQGQLPPISSSDPTLAKPNHVLIQKGDTYNYCHLGTKAALQSMQRLITFFASFTKIKYNLAAFDQTMEREDYNKSNIQSLGQLKGGASGMNFIYYAWTYNFAFNGQGRNILKGEIFS